MSTFISVLIITALLALIVFQGYSLIKLFYSKFKKIPDESKNEELKDEESSEKK